MRGVTVKRGGVSQHVHEVFTDSAFSEEAPGIGFAGCGVWFAPLDAKNISFHLPSLEQTNTRAQMLPVITVLH